MSPRTEAILLTLCRLLSVPAGRRNHHHACDQRQDYHHQQQAGVHHNQCEDHYWDHHKCQDIFYDHQDWWHDHDCWLDHDRSSCERVRQPIRRQANLRQPVLRF
jgi:hypothetical protein